MNPYAPAGEIWGAGCSLKKRGTRGKRGLKPPLFRGIRSGRGAPTGGGGKQTGRSRNALRDQLTSQASRQRVSGFVGRLAVPPCGLAGIARHIGNHTEFVGRIGMSRCGRTTEPALALRDVASLVASPADPEHRAVVAVFRCLAIPVALADSSHRGIRRTMPAARTRAEARSRNIRTLANAARDHRPGIGDSRRCSCVPAALPSLGTAFPSRSCRGGPTTWPGRPLVRCGGGRRCSRGRGLERRRPEVVALARP
ncbi:hypothetical protein EHYA_04739 [Embleya hyalina]|uniref:Uncharacterized protein n=1 Tax=Embleya hyalina TaxID=516124 RepID=A0A401YR35_9ACTN|nr:hypothetical protein EHYA_04739 [Embleya hyalina]